MISRKLNWAMSRLLENHQNSSEVLEVPSSWIMPVPWGCSLLLLLFRILRKRWKPNTCCTENELILSEMEPRSSQPPYISDVRLDLFIILWFHSFIWSQRTEINSLVMAILCLCVTPSHPLLLFFLLLLDPPLPSGSGVGFHLCVEAQLSAITLGLHLHKLARKC